MTEMKFMDKSTALNEFLSRNRIDMADWEKSGLLWEQLQAIAEDHDKQFDYLRDSAELSARVIQRFTGVHSVRWRVKDTEHLLEKIVRKRAKDEKKYQTIDEYNYFEIVRDLVGLRALHLFKDDCFSIDEQLRSTWDPAEDPIAYVREGDPADLRDRFAALGFSVKQHPAGYRSVHYVCATQPMKRKVYAEIQVRTIFEEAWSEIDHRVRYPNFSDNELVSYFLAIFNRLAGSADEMGTFIQELTRTLTYSEQDIARANSEKEEALAVVENMIFEIDELKKQGVDSDVKIASLRSEVEKLRSLSTGGISTYKEESLLMSAAARGFDPVVGRTLKSAASIMNEKEMMRLLINSSQLSLAERMEKDAMRNFNCN